MVPSQRERTVMVIRARDVAADDIVKRSAVASRDKPANMIAEDTDLLVLLHLVDQQGLPFSSNLTKLIRQRLILYMETVMKWHWGSPNAHIFIPPRLHWMRCKLKIFLYIVDKKQLPNKFLIDRRLLEGSCPYKACFNTCSIIGFSGCVAMQIVTLGSHN